ncbi:MAG: ArsC family reductase [Gammaproteobacteria bacterium]|nr:ArsC family reductase [Gammaproteobacteria bacterium]
MTLYGIANCDNIKKTRAWLDSQGICYRFHDVRADGLEATRLAVWIRELGWQAVMNCRGLTWRKLTRDEKHNIDDAKALTLMLRYPALIKRPLLECGGRHVVGFDPQQIKALCP